MEVVAILRESGDQAGALMSPSSTTEEFFLAQSLLRQLGSGHIDHRLREADFSDDAAAPVAPAFEMKVGEMDGADAVLLVGSNPRQEWVAAPVPCSSRSPHHRAPDSPGLAQGRAGLGL